ncbi:MULTISPECIES: lantibiotic protection ABC transporter ATP-binding subunit [Paenibacillus]|uniref:Lantibiotic ABC transporter ATP-binding protein n=1 Tax=Paenibacillus azoreducens TaxID=116718 RepID=A0A919YBG6_9BACL|nr:MULTISPECIES: lantibiotic protection ABC transporter ATP-binding subunit [Paenibacillus]MBE9916050.1 lantibiotic protection ABC transporter ATP-binding subunit [Paenibacillus donghaensis]GIO46658.1 lantibiotic ABC transporter ATP-binding protein [Paenibacillus azoreducens]
MNYVVETINLTKAYKKQAAVDGVHLQISRGKVFGLLGPNGAGKTTLLKLLVGLLRPTSGEIKLFGEPWRRESLARIGALIETPAIYGHLTGRENLQVHQRLLGIPVSRIDRVLEIVGLHKVDRKKKAAAYSLGMKQRLGIAIALLNEPELLILDEPTNGLDPLGIREMRTLIESFTDQGITVILSSHILSEVAQIVQEVGIVSHGKLRFQGTLDNLMTQGSGQENLEELFMHYVDEGKEALYR